MSSSTPRGLPGFLRRSMRSDMMMGDDDGRIGSGYSEDDDGSNDNNGTSSDTSSAKRTASPTLTSLIPSSTQKPKPPLSSNRHDHDHGQSGDETETVTPVTTETETEEDIVDTVDRKFRFFKSTNVSSSGETTTHRTGTLSDGNSKSGTNGNTNTNERIGRKLSFEQNGSDAKNVYGTVSSAAGGTSTSAKNGSNINGNSDKGAVTASPTRQGISTLKISPGPSPLPPSSISTSTLTSTRENSNNNSTNSIPKINTSPLSSSKGRSRSREISLSGSASPSTSSSNTQQQQQQQKKSSSRRSSMNYKEIEFEKVINEPVVNIAALRKLGWNGIPAQHRPQAWKILLGYLPTNKTRRTQTLKRKRLEYLDIIKQHYDISDNTRTNAEQETLRQVLVDVPRTAPDVPLFRNDLVRQSLSRLLYIWACRHPASSYVQGINDLATPLIAVFLSEFYDNQRSSRSNGSDGGGTSVGVNNGGGSSMHESIHEGSVLDGSVMDDLALEDLKNVEADVYWCLTNLLAGIQDHYTSDQPGVQRMVMRLEDLVNRMDGELTHHLRSVGVEFIQFAFRWMNCLLLREFKLECVIRLWDTYLSEGDGAGFALGFETFHVYVCAAFLCQFSGLLRNMEFDELFGFMQNVPTSDWTDNEIEVLLSQAFVLSTLFHGSDAHLNGQGR